MISPRGALALSTCILLVATAGCDSGSGAGPSVSSVARAAAHTVTGPQASGSGYTLELLDGASTVDVVATDLGGPLYRVQTAAGSTTLPGARLVDHTVDVRLRGGGNGAVRILLDRGVRWRLRFAAGASTATVDMADGQLAGLAAVKGIGSLDVTAGRPAAAVMLSEAAGVSTFTLHVPASSAVTVRARAGAGTVTLFGQAHRGVAAGATLSTQPAAAARYEIDAVGGVGTLSVDG
ncbi:hypothetical protein [Jatrophihabitans sp.]|uniref:hypothetical protein n=1 Tax=Jatrophihabitans sp. TaxID=1932789 RepID=UPI0030C75042|nr:hypothetical protein [Jatrophihabitans sp.]